MRKLVMLLITGLMSFFLVTPAQAADPGPSQFFFTQPTAFGGPDCRPGKESVCKYNNRLVQFVKGVPCSPKESISLTIFFFSYDALGPALEEKANCGVQMTLVARYPLDKKNREEKLHPNLIHLLNYTKKMKNVKSKVCHGSCFDNDNKKGARKRNINHVKVATFSQSLGQSWIVVNSSNNISYAGDREGLGDWTEDYNDKAVYDGVRKFVKAQLADKKQSACKYGAKSKDGKVTFLTQPCDNDPLPGLFAKAHGGSAGCRIDHQFSFASYSYVKKILPDLIRIKKERCAVSILMNYSGGDEGTWETRIARAAAKGGIEIRDAGYNEQYKGTYYNHKKTALLQNVLINKKSINMVMSGSATATTGGWKYNVNLMRVSYRSDDILEARWSNDYALNHARVLTYQQLCAKKLSGC